MKNLRITLTSLLAAIAANTIFYLWGRHTFMPLGLIWVSAALLGLLLLVLAAILNAFNKSRPDPAARLTIRMSVASALVCFALLPTVPLLHAQQRADLAAAQTRADELIATLATYHQTHNAYPPTLDPIAGPTPLPWLLREPETYRSSTTGYVIQIRHPGNPFTANERRHNETRWRTTQ
ncbi:MAG: hypothetical protein M9935_04850 [Kiritimatiellae bacterium]|nr:hypothetical protein [Kiritimatiellia bacterium]